jgi:anti-anti-sigma regulatory factor
MSSSAIGTLVKIMESLRYNKAELVFDFNSNNTRR